jgi:glucose/arabinose dehydrogenase
MPSTWRTPARVRLVAVAASFVVLVGLVAVLADDDRPDDVATDDGGSTTTTSRSTSTSATAPTSTSTTAKSPMTTAPTTAAPPSTGGGTTEPPATSAPPAADPGSPAPTPLASLRVGLAPVATLAAPTAMSARPGSGELWFAERGGGVVALRGGSPVVLADLGGETTTDGERGLLGLAFDAPGAHVYLGFTDLEGDVRLDEVAIDGNGGLDLASRRTLVEVQHRTASNHNGGAVARGPDGAIYFGVGDGGGGGDPAGNAQNPGVLLGKLLRIDPASGAVAVAALGLRNPWRFSFDRATGDLWLADVGQGLWEEVNRVPFGSVAGADFGWDRMEGTHRFEGGPEGGDVAPVYEYGHDRGCSVTGGHVYRGSAVPGLQGAYVYGDFCEGVVRAIRVDAAGVVVEDVAFDLGVDQLASFGEDAAGEIYALSLGGSVTRLVG